MASQGLRQGLPFTPVVPPGQCLIRGR